ncbi:MAG: RES domain-containing protein [Gammaproteobacteria bacterium]|nr:RES domain-containing protein [Gammaproteobacteria bacterium]MYA67285.1 RES domain-containing protein [Gammaproteobacteria bacterium]MYF01247.1 RES domain-containing protein [Gammaproteobacteria bacterium]MYG97187.1 RES domain-containing protein [Gammaproteobacteria bacterium]MYH46765.1 RES domain-containing protein [Gammaproteobacteria bacterium]
MRFQGLAYRAHDPQWAWDPLSGEGAGRHGGRFNRRGVNALYLSLSPFAAIKEVKPPKRPLQPIVLCAYEVDVAPVFDCADERKRNEMGIAERDLACPNWELEMYSGLIPASQTMADRLLAAGFAGMRVRSFAAAAGPVDLNLVLWKWGASLPERVMLIDDENRLAFRRKPDR